MILTLAEYIPILNVEVFVLVVKFVELSKALDAFNANRIESEQVEWHELIKVLNDPYDVVEVMELIIELYEEA